MPESVATSIFHVSHHIFGTLLITARVDISTAGKLMRHADVRATQAYAKFIDSKKIEAVNIVDKPFGNKLISIKGV